MAKTQEEVTNEVLKFLNQSTDMDENPAIDVSVADTKFGPEIVISSKGHFVGIHPEEGSKGRRFVLKVYFGTDNDRLPKEERMADNSRMVQGNDFMLWSHDDTLLGRFFFSKTDAANAGSTRDQILNLLDGWVEEVHLRTKK